MDRRIASSLGVPAVFAALALLVLSPGGEAAAQIPGGDPTRVEERRDIIRARVRAEALEGVRKTLEEWSDAWLEDKPRRLSKLYRVTASVRGLPFGTGFGRGQIRSRFSGFLEESGSIRLEVSEFDARGSLAYSVADYRYRRLDPGSSRDRLRKGTVLMVFEKAGGGWRIRSQLFRPEAEDSG